MEGSSSSESKPDVEPVTPSSSRSEVLPPDKRHVKPVNRSRSLELLPPSRSELMRELRRLRRRSLSLVHRGPGLRQSIVQHKVYKLMSELRRLRRRSLRLAEETWPDHLIFKHKVYKLMSELCRLRRRSLRPARRGPGLRQIIVQHEEPDGKPLTRSSSLELLPPSMSELRVVLLGNSWSQSSSVGNFILGETKFNTEEEPDCCQRERGQLKEKEIVLINTPDLLLPSILQHELRRPVENCVRLSDPGPHVFLLVLQPEDFTEEVKLRLCRVLKLFSDRSFDHSLVLISTPREESPGFMDKYMNHPPLKDMIRKCRYRFLWRKNLELPELLTRLGLIVRENNEKHLSLPRGIKQSRPHSSSPAETSICTQRSKKDFSSQHHFS